VKDSGPTRLDEALKNIMNKFVSLVADKGRFKLRRVKALAGIGLRRSSQRYLSLCGYWSGFYTIP